MKVKIVVENSKKGKVEIPISLKEARDVYDSFYMVKDSFETVKLNKCDKSFLSFHRKLEHMIHDIIDDGRVYHEIKDVKGRKKWVLADKRKFSVKKPRWKK